MILELLLTMALDMSLPEFQPEVDISGNVIVSEFDISSCDVSACEVPLDDININDSQSKNISTEKTETVYYSTQSLDASNNDIVTAIENMNYDNNVYWELFLDSYSVENNYSTVGVKLNNPTFKISSAGQLLPIENSTISVSYIPVMNNVTYTFTNLKPNNYNNFFLGVVDDINNPTVLYNFRLTQTYPTEFTVKPDIDGYFVVLMYGTHNITFDANWTLVEKESYTLSEIGNAIMNTYKSINAVVLILLFMAFCPFLTKVVDKFMFRKED